MTMPKTIIAKMEGECPIEETCKYPQYVINSGIAVGNNCSEKVYENCVFNEDTEANVKQTQLENKWIYNLE